MLVKGGFDPYVLGPFDKKLISQLVTRVRTRDYMVDTITELIHEFSLANVFKKDQSKIYMLPSDWSTKFGYFKEHSPSNF